MKTVYAAIAGAWALAIAAEASGSAHALHHDALIEHGPALPIALVLFLVAWQAMTAAMMLPSSLPLIRMYAAHEGRSRSLAAFLGGYAVVWSAFGALAFLGDTAVHHTVDAWPWLAAHDWLVAALTFALAGAFQFSSLKDACLRSCRHPGAYLLKHYRPGPRGGFRLGAGHGIFCVGCCWALMLVMFAAGVASLVWMGALTALMVVEKTGRSGRRFVPVTGATFLALAALTAVPAMAAAPRAIVSGGGATTGDCRAPAAPCTLGHALASLQTGDELVLAPGNYPAGSITIGKPDVTFRGTDGAAAPKLDLQGFNFGASAAATNLTVRHVELDSAGVSFSSTTPIIEAFAGGTFRDLRIVGSGNVAGFRSGAAADLSGSTVEITKDPTDNGPRVQSIQSSGGATLRLRDVQVIRHDANIGAAVGTGSAGSAVEADELRVTTEGAGCVRTSGNAGGSTFRDSDFTQTLPVSTTLGVACLDIGAQRPTLQRIRVAARGTPSAFPSAILLNSATSGLVEDVTASAPHGNAFFASGDGLTIRRSVFSGGSGVQLAGQGSTGIAMTDSVALATDGSAVFVGTGTAQLRNVTALSSGTNGVAADVMQVPAAAVGLRNVIARGAVNDLRARTGSIDVAFSSFDPAKAVASDGGSIAAGAGNQDAGPGLDATYHQVAGSPTIDAGTPDALLGPTDPDGDARTLGAAPDIGADEFVPPPPVAVPDSTPAGPPPAPAPSLSPPAGRRDTTRPILKGLSLRGRRLRFTLSEAATVRITLAGRKGKRTRLRAVRLRAGTRSITRPRLGPGRYRATLTATDAAGNRSKPRTLAFTVR